MPPVRILIIATSHEQMGATDRKTGLWLEELAVPYYIFLEAGAQLTFASPKGGPIPLDRKSESIIVSNTSIRRFQKDATALALLDHSVALQTQNAEDFDAVFVTGGYGPLWDFTGDEPLKLLLEDFNRRGKIIGAICHGVAALLNLRNSIGEPFVKGRRVTAFSNTEEQISGLTDIVPFSIESTLITRGASYTKGADFTSHIVVDGNLITGQNASSSRDLAKMLLTAQKDSTKKTGSSVY